MITPEESLRHQGETTESLMKNTERNIDEGLRSLPPGRTFKLNVGSSMTSVERQNRLEELLEAYRKVGWDIRVNLEIGAIQIRHRGT